MDSEGLSKFSEFLASGLKFQREFFECCEIGHFYHTFPFLSFYGVDTVLVWQTTVSDEAQLDFCENQLPNSTPPQPTRGSWEPCNAVP